jgi:c-di-GMP-binding flagellar brake protein YcgR
MVEQPSTPPHGLTDTSDDDASKFAVSWKKEIVFILRAVMEKGELVSAYFNRGESFLLTSIVGVDPDRGVMYLDFGANEAMNRKILDSDKIIFVTTHEKVKVQFTAAYIEKVLFEGRDSFKIALPDTLIKLQRREYFRVTTPIINPLKCIVPMPDNRKVEVAIVDISIGGIGIILPPADTLIEPGATFQGCHLILPDIGNIIATMEIRNVFEVTLRNGLKTKRAGCQFIDLSANMQSMIQRYIIKVERDRRAMQLDRE